jgi:predicted dehydrogenase
VAVVGCGRWGALVVADLRSLGAEVVTVDVDAERDPDVADIADAGAVAAIVVATPASTHADVLRSVAPLGVPVLCEKPLTASVADAEDVVALLGDRLHVLHVWRYHLGVELLGELARGGVLGEVHGMRSVRDGWTSPRTDVDAVWTLVPHDLTLAIEVLGRIPTPRAALAEVLGGRAVGLWAQLGGAGEPFLAVEASTRFGDKRREVRVHGSEAVAVLPHVDAAEVVLERGSGEAPDVERIPFVPDPPLRRTLAAFLDHVVGSGTPPKSSGSEGLEVVRAIAALRDLAGLAP